MVKAERNEASGRKPQSFLFFFRLKRVQDKKAVRRCQVARFVARRARVTPPLRTYRYLVRNTFRAVTVDCYPKIPRVAVQCNYGSIHATISRRISQKKPHSIRERVHKGQIHTLEHGL